jgi:O-antigen/teichoic acid export membrane protein
MSDTRRIAKNTLMLYSRQIVVMLVNLYMVRVVLNILGTVDYGIYNVVGGVVAMFGFLTSTLANGTQRFLTFQLGKNDFEELKKVFATALNIHIILAAIILVFAETAGLWFLNQKLNIPADRRTAAFWVYQVSVLAILLSIIQAPYNASIIAHERMNIYAYISIVEVFAKLILVFMLRFSNYDKLISYSVLILIVQIIVLSIYRIYCKRQYHECRFMIVSDRALYKPMLEFSQWLILSLAGNYTATYGINFLLNIFFGPAINAARAVSVQVNNAASSFVTNFQTAVNPSIVKYYAADKKEELFTLIFQNTKFSFCLMWLIALPFFLKIDIVLMYWLKEAPEYTSIFCRFMIVDSLISCIMRPFNMAIQAIGRLKWICIFVAVIYVFVSPVSYFFLKIGMPVYVPVIMYMIAHAADLLNQIRFLHKNISLPVKRLVAEVFFRLLLMACCSLPGALLANYYLKDGIVSLILVSLISVLSVLVSSYFIAIDKDMRAKIIHRVAPAFMRIR